MTFRFALAFVLLTQGAVSSSGPAAQGPVSSVPARSSTLDANREASRVPAKPGQPVSQSKDDDRLEVYTYWLALFTGALVLFTALLGAVSIWQGRLLTREFIATHRPRLRIRQVELVSDGDEPAIEFTVVNVGESAATIVESSVKSWIQPSGERLPGMPPYDPPTQQPRTRRLENGEATRWRETDAPGHCLLAIASATHDLMGVMLLGYLVYSDENGIRRRVGFCRRRIQGTSCFDPVENADYEYED